MTTLLVSEPFDFQPRTRLIYGKGSLDALAGYVREIASRRIQSAKSQAPRVLLVSDAGVVGAGHVDRAVGLLEKAGVKARVFDGVVENPTDASVYSGLKVARAAGADLILALGGGSVMDCAKGIGLLLTSGGRLADYKGHGKVPRPLPALLAVPTTAGTGSEVQSAALITETSTREKMVLRDPKLSPRAAILDPRLTLTMPPEVTAASGIDALSHAVESYVCTRATALSRTFARSAFRHLLPAFEKVLAAPDSLEARGDMLLGASFAGLSIEHSMLGAAHSLANPVTTRYGATHGLAVGVLLPHVVRYNGEEVALSERYGELLREAPAQDAAPARPAAALAERLRELLSRAKLPSRLRDLGVEELALPELAEEAQGQWTVAFNPRRVKAPELLEIYRCAF